MRNDGRCAAIAESIFGAGKSAKCFSFLTLGTGIGGSLVLDGKLLDGMSFDAGDFGHHVICSGSEAFDCACGKRGCFETQASAQGFLRHVAAEAKRRGDSRNALLQLPDAHSVIEAMRKGDECCSAAFARFKGDLATGLANLVTFYNPDVIGLGGGLSQAPEVLDGLQDLVDERTLPATRGVTSIVASSVGPDAGAIGAACLALEALPQASGPECT